MTATRGPIIEFRSTRAGSGNTTNAMAAAFILASEYGLDVLYEACEDDADIIAALASTGGRPRVGRFGIGIEPIETGRGRVTFDLYRARTGPDAHHDMDPGEAVVIDGPPLAYETAPSALWHADRRAQGVLTTGLGIVERRRAESVTDVAACLIRAAQGMVDSAVEHYAHDLAAWIEAPTEHYDEGLVGVFADTGDIADLVGCAEDGENAGLVNAIRRAVARATSEWARINE